MRKALSVFIAVCLVLSLFTGIFVSMPSARAATEGDYTYTTSGSPLTATITSYTGAGGDVTIPDTLGGYPVAGIGYQAFSGKVALTNVAIPNSVTTIGVQAFYGCTGLTSVTIPNSVTSIEAGAFWTCTGLITVTIPDSVTSIGGGMYGGAFQSCTKLTSVVIGSGVTSIGVGMLMDCSSLTSVTIPVGVTSIGGYAFENCTGLTNVTIPDSVVTIGEEAFCGCTKLTSVTIGSGVTSIGRSAFNRCTGLTSVTIPSSVTSIDIYAFAGCTGLTSVTIGTSVTSIGDGAFSYCGMLTAAYFLGNAPTTMGTNVFPATGFTIWYISGTADWTNPLWYGYPTATSVINSYTLTYTPGTNGTITGTVSQAVYAGADGTEVTAVPNSGYHFVQWNDGITTAARTDTNVTANISVASTFAIDPPLPAPVPTPSPAPAPVPTPTPSPAPAPVPVPVKKQMVLIFQIGKPMFWDNSIPTKLDSTPVIKNSRTLLPIRAIIEALGGTVAWDPIAHKVTVTLGTKTVVLWIGKSLATVNGVSTPIDATDASVVPEIINGRTMLSLRFISENLGATVGSDQNTQTITITYTP